jgi:hypothetical protein
MKTLQEVKRDIKRLGYRVKTHRYMDFIALSVMTQDRETLNSGFTTKEKYNQHKQLFEYISKHKGKVFDGMIQVVI